MATYIRCLNIENRNQILVNGKTVRKDMDGTWTADQELSLAEAKAFNAFRETIEKVTPKDWKFECMQNMEKTGIPPVELLE